MENNSRLATRMKETLSKYKRGLFNNVKNCYKDDNIYCKVCTDANHEIRKTSVLGHLSLSKHTNSAESICVCGQRFPFETYATKAVYYRHVYECIMKREISANMKKLFRTLTSDETTDDPTVSMVADHPTTSTVVVPTISKSTMRLTTSETPSQSTIESSTTPAKSTSISSIFLTAPSESSPHPPSILSSDRSIEKDFTKPPVEFIVDEIVATKRNNDGNRKRKNSDGSTSIVSSISSESMLESRMKKRKLQAKTEIKIEEKLETVSETTVKSNEIKKVVKDEDPTKVMAKHEPKTEIETPVTHVKFETDHESKETGHESNKEFVKIDQRETNSITATTSSSRLGMASSSTALTTATTTVTTLPTTKKNQYKRKRNRPENALRVAFVRFAVNYIEVNEEHFKINCSVCFEIVPLNQLFRHSAKHYNRNFNAKICIKCNRYFFFVDGESLLRVQYYRHVMECMTDTRMPTNVDDFWHERFRQLIDRHRQMYVHDENFDVKFSRSYDELRVSDGNRSLPTSTFYRDYIEYYVMPRLYQQIDDNPCDSEEAIYSVLTHRRSRRRRAKRRDIRRDQQRRDDKIIPENGDHDHRNDRNYNNKNINNDDYNNDDKDDDDDDDDDHNVNIDNDDDDDDDMNDDILSPPNEEVRIEYERYDNCYTCQPLPRDNDMNPTIVSVLDRFGKNELFLNRPKPTWLCDKVQPRYVDGDDCLDENLCGMTEWLIALSSLISNVIPEKESEKNTRNDNVLDTSDEKRRVNDKHDESNEKTVKRDKNKDKRNKLAVDSDVLCNRNDDIFPSTTDLFPKIMSWFASSASSTDTSKQRTNTTTKTKIDTTTIDTTTDTTTIDTTTDTTTINITTDATTIDTTTTTMTTTMTTTTNATTNNAIDTTMDTTMNTTDTSTEKTSSNVSIVNNTKTASKVIFCHVYVYEQSIEQALKELFENPDRYYVLPNTCLCYDPVKRSNDNVHRHMIVAFRNQAARLKYIRKISYNSARTLRAPKRKTQYCLEIKNKRHFFFAVRYVSREKMHFNSKLRQIVQRYSNYDYNERKMHVSLTSVLRETELTGLNKPRLPYGMDDTLNQFTEYIGSVHANDDCKKTGKRNVAKKNKRGNDKNADKDNVEKTAEDIDMYDTNATLNLYKHSENNVHVYISRPVCSKFKHLAAVSYETGLDDLLMYSVLTDKLHFRLCMESKPVVLSTRNANIESLAVNFDSIRTAIDANVMNHLFPYKNLDKSSESRIVEITERLRARGVKIASSGRSMPIRVYSDYANTIVRLPASMVRRIARDRMVYDRMLRLVHKQRRMIRDQAMTIEYLRARCFSDSDNIKIGGNSKTKYKRKRKIKCDIKSKNDDCDNYCTDDNDENDNDGDNRADDDDDDTEGKYNDNDDDGFNRKNVRIEEKQNTTKRKKRYERMDDNDIDDNLSVNDNLSINESKMNVNETINNDHDADDGGGDSDMIIFDNLL